MKLWRKMSKKGPNGERMGRQLKMFTVGHNIKGGVYPLLAALYNRAGIQLITPEEIVSDESK